MLRRAPASARRIQRRDQKAVWEQKGRFLIQDSVKRLPVGAQLLLRFRPVGERRLQNIPGARPAPPPRAELQTACLRGETDSCSARAESRSSSGVSSTFRCSAAEAGLLMPRERMSPSARRSAEVQHVQTPARRQGRGKEGVTLSV